MASMAATLGVGTTPKECEGYADCVRLICVDLQNNHNKFWNGFEMPDGRVYSHWGRVGDPGRLTDYGYGGSALLHRKADEKRYPKAGKDPYRDAAVIDNSPRSNGSSRPTPRVDNRELKEIATREIATNSPETVELVKMLADANIHAITQATKVTYNAATGLFSTPLGILTAPAISEARAMLSNIATLIEQNRHDDIVTLERVADYMHIVPQDIGRQRLTTRLIFPDMAAVQRQNDILDALEVSLQTATAPPKTDEASPTPPPAKRVFETKLFLIDDGKVMDAIAAKFTKTLNRQHYSVSSLKPRRAWRVEIVKSVESFERVGKPLGNIQELWHGTKPQHVLSILYKGLVIPPSNDPNCTGRLFGNGVYFANQSSKALQYSAGTAPGQYGGVHGGGYFMFLADVALGKPYVPMGYHECMRFNAAKPGYDSTWAKGGQSGVMNDEIIVYNLAQQNLVTLVEFTKDGK